MNLQFPVGGIFCASVEARDTVKMLDQVRTERCIYNHSLRDVGIHLFLNQRCMKMSGIKRD